MKIRFAMAAALVACTVSTGLASAQACPARSIAVAPAGQTSDLVFTTVRYLSDDALEGRGSGTAGERCAGDFIAAEMARLGLRPGGDAGTFFQSVPLASAINPHAAGGTGRNVIGILEGSDPSLRNEIIVVGAHYDHLGREATFSLSPDSVGAIHNGADDNASGVAAMLATAEALTREGRPGRPVAFVAFTGEELGLLGSGVFARSAIVQGIAIKAMLNMDMVGRLAAGPLLVYGTGTATEWPELVRAAAAAESIRVSTISDGFGPSDHTSFYARDVPVLHFFTNVHGDYHKPTDDWEKVDYPGLRRVTALVARLTRDAGNSRPALTLLRGAGSAATAPPAQDAASAAYLGTVPDFAPVERGVLLSGATPGSPADRAGIRGGDVLTRIGDHAVANLQDFTNALRAHKPGDRVRISVLRGGQEMTFEATLGSRANM